MPRVLSAVRRFGGAMFVTQNQLAKALAATLGAVTLTAAMPLRAEGVELHYGLGLRLETESNVALDPVSAGNSQSAALTLSFGLISETALSRLDISASGNLQAANGPDNPHNGLVDPAVRLSYDRAVATADFNFSASAIKTNLADSDVTNFDTGAGTRQTNAVSTALNWGNSAPLGFGLSASLEDVQYDSADPRLYDRRTEQLGASLRADLSQVLELTLAANASRFEPATGARRDTTGLQLGLNLAQPHGMFGATLGLDDTPDGQRQRLDFTHQLELPQSALSYTLGATHSINDNFYMTGALNYQHALPKGNLNLDLNRAVTSSDTTDTETLQTSAALNWHQDVTATGSLTLGLSWAESVETASDLATTNTRLSATWRQALGQDWALDLGYTHRLRDEDGIGRGQSNLMFLELRRDVSVRY